MGQISNLTINAQAPFPALVPILPLRQELLSKIHFLMPVAPKVISPTFNVYFMNSFFKNNDDNTVYNVE